MNCLMPWEVSPIFKWHWTLVAGEWPLFCMNCSVPWEVSACFEYLQTLFAWEGFHISMRELMRFEVAWFSIPHNMQGKSFAPVCPLWWILNFCIILKVLSQILHLNDLSSEWVVRWFSRCSALLKDLAHSSQENGRISACIFLWLFSRLKILNVLEHCKQEYTSKVSNHCV